jgi:NAD(P)-dependent dehydrogenase (short-subunit alcohol dehydrogenase family)
MHTSSHINASLAGLVRVPGLAAYAAAKHGVMGLTQAAALDCASQAVRVNALVTGNVDTPLFRRFRGTPPTANSRSRRRIPPSGSPSRRSSLPSPSCSVRGRFITGAALVIDGGYVAAQ